MVSFPRWRCDAGTGNRQVRRTRIQTDAARQPLAPSTMGAVVDSPGYTRRRRLAVGNGRNRRAVIIGPPAVPGCGIGCVCRCCGHIDIPPGQASGAAQTTSGYPAALLGARDNTRPVFVSIGPLDHGLRGGFIARLFLSGNNAGADHSGGKCGDFTRGLWNAFPERRSRGFWVRGAARVRGFPFSLFTFDVLTTSD